MSVKHKEDAYGFDSLDFPVMVKASIPEGLYRYTIKLTSLNKQGYRFILDKIKNSNESSLSNIDASLFSDKRFSGVVRAEIR